MFPEPRCRSCVVNASVEAEHLFSSLYFDQSWFSVMGSVAATRSFFAMDHSHMYQAKRVREPQDVSLSVPCQGLILKSDPQNSKEPH